MKANAKKGGSCHLMHVVICEDERHFQDAIRHIVDSWKASTGHQDVTCQCFGSSEDLLLNLEEGLSAELLFLDIQIPGELNGMELAKRIRQRDEHATIVFVTNYADYVYEGYTVNALRYLKKPVQSVDVFACLEIAHRRFSALSQDQLTVNCQNKQLVLSLSEIVYVEIKSHYAQLVLHQSDEKPRIRTSLCDFSTQLPSQFFIQCHRSYIVNLDHIRRFSRESLTMSNQDTIPVSQTFAAHLKKRYEWYYTDGKDE